MDTLFCINYQKIYHYRNLQKISQALTDQAVSLHWQAITILFCQLQTFAFSTELSAA